jgi:S-adenosylmethionine:tRNA ribosyltransferase-isomerase
MSELDQYDYELPRHLIAQQPLPCRADARMLVVDRGQKSFTHKHIRDLPEVLAAGDCLVLNDTQVIPARLVGYRTDTGGHWEGLFLAADEAGCWRVLCKARGRLAPGIKVTLVNAAGQDDIQLRLLQKWEEGAWVARPETPEATFSLLERVGRVPLPHYIRGGRMTETDRRQYQTVFAAKPGAVAAPTAGLHFTQDLLDQLDRARVERCCVTLHVGLGTFRPIKAASLAEHRMHTEWGQIGPEAVARIHRARAAGGRVVAVGTTAVRVLETAARDGELRPWTGETDLFIRPPYRFLAVEALLTNFHLPRSTLLVLVRTFGGDELMRAAYQEAIREEYRFYSYGDAMLIL